MSGQFPGGEGGKADEHVDVYANALRVGITPWDFTLVFGQTEDLGPDRIVTRDKANVRLSPQMAKHVMLSLQSAMEAFEAGYGEVHVPKAVKDQNDANKKKLSQFIRKQEGTS